MLEGEANPRSHLPTSFPIESNYDGKVSILVASQATSAYLSLQVISRAALKEGFVELCGTICEQIVEIGKFFTQAVCNIIRGIYTPTAKQPLWQSSLPVMLRKRLTRRMQNRHFANNSDRNFYCNVNPILPSFRSMIMIFSTSSSLHTFPTSLSTTSHILFHSTNSTRDERRIPNKPRHGHYAVTCQRTRSKP